MTQRISFGQLDTMTLYWLVAVVCAASLFGYANKRVSALHRQEKQNGPDLTGQYNWLHGLFLFSYGVSLVSFVGLTIQSLSVGLFVLIPIAALSSNSLNRWLSSGLRALGQYRARLHWPVSGRPVRIGLLGASGLGTLSLVEPESMLCYASLTAEPSPAVSSVMVGYFGTGLWTWADYAVILSITLLGSALWQATKQIRQENSFLFPTIERTYSWRTDSLLLSYLTLLLLLVGLTTLITFSSVSAYTFWIGYAIVLLSQLTPTGQRFGKRLLGGIESLIESTNRAVR